MLKFLGEIDSIFPEAQQKRDGFQGDYLLCILEEKRYHCGKLDRCW